MRLLLLLLVLLTANCLLAEITPSSILYLNEKGSVCVQHLETGKTDTIRHLSETKIVKFRYSEGLIAYFKRSELLKPMFLYPNPEADSFEFGRIKQQEDGYSFTKLTLPPELDTASITNFFLIPKENGEILFELSDSDFSHTYYVLYNFLDKRVNRLRVNKKIVGALFKDNNQLYLQTSNNTIIKFDKVSNEVSEIKDVNYLIFWGKTKKLDFLLKDLVINQASFFEPPNIGFYFSVTPCIKIQLKIAFMDTLIENTQIRISYNTLILSDLKDSLSQVIYSPLKNERISTLDDAFILNHEPTLRYCVLNTTGEILISAYNPNLELAKLFLYNSSNGSLKEVASSFKTEDEFYLL